MAPWDWSGILLARIIHEAAFFALVTDSETQQRSVLEQFIDEVGKEECGATKLIKFLIIGVDH